MNDPNRRPLFVTGENVEYLSVSAGTVKEIPIGVLTFRLQNNKPINLMVTRPQLERLKEDITFLLERSISLKDGPSPEISLAELEATRERLG